MWLTVVQILASVYLIGGSLIIDASKNIPSKLIFKVVPMALGLPLAFGSVATLLGWPIL